MTTPTPLTHLSVWHFFVLLTQYHFFLMTFHFDSPNTVLAFKSDPSCVRVCVRMQYVFLASQSLNSTNIFKKKNRKNNE